MHMHKHYCKMKNIYHACRHFAFPAIIASSHTLKPHTAHRCKPRAHCADSPCLFSLLHHMTALILLSLDLHRGDSRAEPRSSIQAWRGFRKLVFCKSTGPEKQQSVNRKAHRQVGYKSQVFFFQEWTWQITQKMEAGGYVSFLFTSQKMLSRPQIINLSHLMSRHTEM